MTPLSIINFFALCVIIMPLSEHHPRVRSESVYLVVSGPGSYFSHMCLYFVVKWGSVKPNWLILDYYVVSIMQISSDTTAKCLCCSLLFCFIQKKSMSLNGTVSVYKRTAVQKNHPPVTLASWTKCIIVRRWKTMRRGCDQPDWGFICVNWLMQSGKRN